MVTIDKAQIDQLFSGQNKTADGLSMFKSSMSFQPLSLPWNMVRSSCVELTERKNNELELIVLNEFLPPSYQRPKNPEKAIKVTLRPDDESGNTYSVVSASAFKNNFTAEANPEAVRIIFETATQCTKDLIERSQTRFDETRFKSLKKDLAQHNTLDNF